MKLLTLTQKSGRYVTVAALAVLSFAAQAQSSAMPHAMPKAGEMPAQSGMSAPGMDMKSMMTDMQDKMMAMKATGNVDTDFAAMMRIHHQAAITMAEAELQNGKDPQMRVMAKDIIRAQKKEIAVFDKFLAKRGVADMKMSEPGMQMKK